MARASHQDGYPLYRQFIAKPAFYFVSEMPICIGMTPHLISRTCWCRHQQAAMHSNFPIFHLAPPLLVLSPTTRHTFQFPNLSPCSAVVGVVTNNSPYIPISQSFTLLNGLLVTTPTMARILLPWGRVRLPVKWRVGVILGQYLSYEPLPTPPVGRESHNPPLLFNLRTPLVLSPTMAQIYFGIPSGRLSTLQTIHS
jgi:hypothetical protein